MVSACSKESFDGYVGYWHDPEIKNYVNQIVKEDDFYILKTNILNRNNDDKFTLTIIDGKLNIDNIPLTLADNGNKLNIENTIFTKMDYNAAENVVKNRSACFDLYDQYQEDEEDRKIKKEKYLKLQSKIPDCDINRIMGGWPLWQ